MKKLTLSEKKQSCIDRINIKELEMQELLLDEKIEEQKKKNFLTGFPTFGPTWMH